MKYQLSKIDSIKGLISALLIISIWTSSLIYALKQNIYELYYWQIILLIGWQAFLYTGLFITAHDAMHGTAFYKSKIMNNMLTTIIMGNMLRINGFNKFLCTTTVKYKLIGLVRPIDLVIELFW